MTLDWLDRLFMAVWTATTLHVMAVYFLVEYQSKKVKNEG